MSKEQYKIQPLSNLIHFQCVTHFLPWLLWRKDHLCLWNFEIHHRSLHIRCHYRTKTFSPGSTLRFENSLLRRLIHEQIFSFVWMSLCGWNAIICSFMQSFISKGNSSHVLFLLVKESDVSYCHFWIKH